MLCPYCFAAKKLLKKLNLNFDEILIDNNPKIKNKMIELSDGRTTVPQVFFGEKWEEQEKQKNVHANHSKQMTTEQRANSMLNF